MIASFFLPLLLLFQVPGAGRPPQTAPSPRPSETPQTRPSPSPSPEEPPVSVKRSVKVGSRTLNYTVTTGYMPIKNAATGETEARIFYMAYTLDDPPAKRPLMFSFNGGPGSASVWLHLGALGPRRVKMLDDGLMPPPPYELVD
ncbi:MAG: peptidase S10, partial [Acidobacteria bacterium]|nr:peptidase S10 [Acidobacteriota bacterium]